MGLCGTPILVIKQIPKEESVEPRTGSTALTLGYKSIHVSHWLSKSKIRCCQGSLISMCRVAVPGNGWYDSDHGTIFDDASMLGI